ncbi:unnamed protein product [Urochloa humidicola]
MQMDSPSSPLSVLRHRLLSTVCCCFGSGSGERMRWRRRAGVGEFRYDPLSYALNFDEGDLLDADEEEDQVFAGRGGDGRLYQSFSSRLSTPVVGIEVA